MNVAILFAICVIFQNNPIAVTASLGFYFEKKTHAELPRQQRQCGLLFEEVERLSQVNWHDVGMHATLEPTDMECGRRTPAHHFGNISGLKQKEMGHHHHPADQ